VHVQEDSRIRRAVHDARQHRQAGQHVDPLRLSVLHRRDPRELAAEGTMDHRVIKDGRPMEIPPDWRAALSQDLR
jgi:hypothetical protein